MTGEFYTYHLGVFSKLLRGWKSTGPIKPATEARVVSRSKGWERVEEGVRDRLDLMCDPASYFDGKPEVQSMDARRLKGGAFLYRPFLRGDGSRHYSVFARIEARSESGEGLPGRRYTHCAALIVEDRWEPELIPWAATMLFDPAMRDEEGNDGFAWGEPIPENHKTRFERRLPPLFRERLAAFRGPGELADWPLGKATDRGPILQAALPGTEAMAHPQIAFAKRLATMLRAEDLAINGRWLSFAFGISTTVDAPGSGFTFRLDDRKPGDPPGAVRVPFSDSDPPVLTEAGLNMRPSDNVSRDRVYGVNWQRLPARSRAPDYVLNAPKGPLFTEDQLWPDQGGRDRSPPEKNAAAGPDDPADPAGQKTLDEVTFREILKPAPHGTETGYTGATRLEVHGRDGDSGGRSGDPDPAVSDVRQILAEATKPVPPRARPAQLDPTPPDAEAPHGATPDGVEAPPAAAAPLPLFAIDWPMVPDTKHHWVLDKTLVPRLHKRLHIFLTLLGMLDTTDFREFGRFDGLTRADRITVDLSDLTPLFVEAFEQLVHMMCIYAATGNPRRLFEPLKALLAHDAHPGIGLRARAEGSLNAKILVSLMQKAIGLKKINLYISRQGRIARDIVAIGGHGPAHLIAPRAEDLEALLEALAPDRGENSIWGPSLYEVAHEVNRVIDEIYLAARNNLLPVFE